MLDEVRPEDVDIAPTSVDSLVRLSCSNAFARAISVGVSDSAEVRMVCELELELELKRTIGGRSEGEGGVYDELVSLTSEAAESRKLSSVDAEVEA